MYFADLLAEDDLDEVLIACMSSLPRRHGISKLPMSRTCLVPQIYGQCC